jgi:3-oxoacyl-[acyl-carrier-protein] synthase III
VVVFEQIESRQSGQMLAFSKTSGNRLKTSFCDQTIALLLQGTWLCQSRVKKKKEEKAKRKRKMWKRGRRKEEEEKEKRKKRKDKRKDKRKKKEKKGKKRQTRLIL